MADLLWDDVKGFLDPDLMGALPDVVVPGASVEDWQAVLDLVNGSGWTCRYRGRGGTPDASRGGRAVPSGRGGVC